MKKFLIITVLMIFSLTICVAEEIVDKVELKMDKLEESMEKLAEKLTEEYGGKVVVSVNSSGSQKVQLGVFPKDLTLADVRELDYDQNYGVLISGVVPGSSASKQKLYAKDIIYEIDGRKVTDDKAFSEILQSYNPGDVARFKIFSAGKHIIKDFTFHAKDQDATIELATEQKAKKKSVDWNSFGINWIPRYYQLDDIADINGLVTNMGFEEIDDDGIFMNGFGFRIHAGGGFYLGGEWSWYKTDDKINHTVTSATATTNVTRKMKYSNNFGGLTLDKRIYMTKYFQPGIGFLIGAGTQKLEFAQSNGDYNWEDFGTDFDNSANNAMTMNKKYVIFQPRVDLYIPILSWLGIRGEVGYMIGYSPESGWKGSDYGITNEPNTKCNGLTFSAGPWIEF